MSSKLVKLTAAQRRLLLGLIHIMEAGDWTEGDYCLTQTQFNALQRAKAELEHPSGVGERHDVIGVSHYEERQCKDCGTAIGNNATGRCLTCQDAVDLRETGTLRR
jgi:hypothetical protein